jgi:hypothetical protein
MAFAALVLSLPVLSTALSQQQPLYSEYSFDPRQHLAGIAPYFEPSDPARDPLPPQGCEVTKAAYLVRHAAINANDFDYESYLEPFTDKLKNTTVDWSKIPSLSFLSTWSPPELKEQERVTRTGKLEATQLGVQLSYRYPNLRMPKRVWASTAERTVVSAEALIRGFQDDDNEINLVQIYEGKESGADSLTPYNTEVYTRPILARLRAMAPEFDWTSDDVTGMFEWCGYDTVVRGSSPFCSLDLFGPDEWLQFEYSQDLMYHHNSKFEMGRVPRSFDICLLDALSKSSLTTRFHSWLRQRNLASHRLSMAERDRQFALLQHLGRSRPLHLLHPPRAPSYRSRSNGPLQQLRADWRERRERHHANNPRQPPPPMDQLVHPALLDEHRRGTDELL